MAAAGVSLAVEANLPEVHTGTRVGVPNIPEKCLGVYPSQEHINKQHVCL